MRVAFAPVSLPAEFPFSGGAVSLQKDDPITLLHRHDCLEVGYCFDGSGVFMIEDKVFPFSRGDVCVINDTELHLAQSAPGTVSRWTWMMMDPVKLVGVLPHGESDMLRIGSFCGPSFVNLMNARTQPEIVEVARCMADEAAGRRSGYRLAIRALAWHLMVLLHRLPAAGRVADGGERGEIRRVGAALEHLAQHYAEPLPIPSLAALCHSSATNFRRLFRKATGQSPLQYLTNLRLQMASTMLSGSGRTILDVSQSVGFETLSSFNRHFRRTFGMSPGAWRNKRGQEDS